MIDDKAHLLQKVILDSTDAVVDVNVDSSGARRGLRAHFRGWTRQGGPVFRLTPSGLNRHVVSLEFGNYARPCIQHIEDHATPEQYAVARALVAQLAKDYEVLISPVNDLGSWTVSPELKIEVTIKGIESQQDDEAVAQSTKAGVVPLIAAVAELICSEDSELDNEGASEGGVIEMEIKRRERSRRNRLLCLNIHGSACGVCTLDPATIYGPDYGNILEVHHIEPLSEISEPKIYDPATDLIPLCPNCHRAIHSRTPAYTPDELREGMLTT